LPVLLTILLEESLSPLLLLSLVITELLVELDWDWPDDCGITVPALSPECCSLTIDDCCSVVIEAAAIPLLIP
jgi:hypothetical protein